MYYKIIFLKMSFSGVNLCLHILVYIIKFNDCIRGITTVDILRARSQVKNKFSCKKLKIIYIAQKI